MKAEDLLEKAAGHLKGRAATYDKLDGERSIGAAVDAFRAVTGDGLMNTGERGWLFMAILKMVRSQQGNYRADNYEDLAAYSALMGEAACEERNGGWTPKAIEAAAFKDACDERDEGAKERDSHVVQAIGAIGGESWQPIGAAPKNRAMFLGYVPHSSGGYICCFYWNNILKQWQNNIDGGCDMPTHWMPLPKPPSN